MNSFFLSFKDMLQEYGVDITVYPYSSPAKKPKFHYEGGIKIPNEDDLVKPETRHEPVLSTNSHSSFMAQFVAGGTKTQVDLIWLSSKKYPKGTTVDVPSQEGKYRVVGYSNYQDYSDVIIYELKGDDKHAS
ncbi:hypothetical protein [Lactobacillus apis]|uniref:hypothetical protein n=1 Tax=Lactobacillus apis TaxID=303541 RepID=UPI00242D4402|nr:hypothetical protein [Lactobacillus apis]